MEIEVKPEHLRKTEDLIVVILSEILMEVKPAQPLKQDSPMEVTLLGMVTEVKPLQPAYLQLIVYQLGMIKTVEK